MGMERLEASDKKILFTLSQHKFSLNKREIANISLLNENTVHSSIIRLQKHNLIISEHVPLRSTCKIKITPLGNIISGYVEKIFLSESKIEQILLKEIHAT